MSKNFHNNTHLNSIIESMPFLAWYKDIEGNFLAVNQPFADSVGKTKDEIIGKTNYDIWSHGLALKYSEDDAEVIKRGQKTVVKEPVDEKTGEILFKTYKSPVFDENNKVVGLLGLSKDISSQMELEDEIKINERLIEIESMQATMAANQMKTQFIDNMSHEIRTPMHAILGYADLLNETIDHEEGKVYISSIKSAGKMLLNIISDILDLSMIESGRIEIQKGYVDIRDFIHEIKNVFKLKADEKGIELKTYIAEDVPRILYLDELHIRQVIFNIFGNAVKFTDSGFVKTSVYVRNKNLKDRGLELVFEIQDTGIGIRLDQHESIFDPFMQSDGQINKKAEGTGLGLSISKRLIDIMKGTITLKSKENEGSTFTVVIPAEYVIDLNDIPPEDTEDNKCEGESNDNYNIEYNIEDDNVQNFSIDMLNELNDIKEDIWLKSKKKNRISDSRKLAERILDIGDRYNNDEIIKCGNTLLNHVNEFNLKYISNTLIEFEYIIDRITNKNLVGGSDNHGDR